MKKLFITLGAAIALLVSTTIIANAQTQKGNWEIGGSSKIGFNTVSTKYKSNGITVDGETINSFNITPNIGYFIKNNLNLGLSLGVNSSMTKDTNGDKLTVSSVIISPYLFYYFTDNKTVKPFLGARAGYASITNKLNSIGQTNGGFAWEVDGGLSYFVSPSIALDMGLGYGQLLFTETLSGLDIKTNHSTFGAQLGISFFIK